jgi:uncharacterized protein (UPF0210 family)
MNIRSVTCFSSVDPREDQSEAILTAGRVAQEASTALEAVGFPVQTMRLATQPLSLVGVDRAEQAARDPLALAIDLWRCCRDAGFEYLSLGPILADGPGADLSQIERLPELVRGTRSVFASVLVTGSDRALNLEAIKRTAGIIREVAQTTASGFGNLRLAAIANVAPHSPFFPAAYHDGGPPALGIATESADLALTAFSQAGSFEAARVRLISAIELAAEKMADCVVPLAKRSGYRFVGIDFSLAPYPDAARSIGAAMEQLGLDCFGAPGSLFVASFITDCLRRADFPRCGFSGLMLPVLEDPILAARTHDGCFTVNDLLLYSAVCGTGLDTVPLPGEVTEAEIAGILLDMASLALRLNKPLTARLMPIPGARAGDLTEFDFPYFSNGRVLEVKGLGSDKLFERGTWLTM